MPDPFRLLGPIVARARLGNGIDNFFYVHDILGPRHQPPGMCNLKMALTAIAPTRPGAGARRPFAKDDTTFVEIIGRHFDLNTIAHDGPDAETPHLARRVSDNPVIILQEDAEAPVRENFIDQAVEGHQILFGHDPIRPTGG